MTVNYCAFLRGVNVNGTSMKMAEACKVFTNAGMKNVSSVLASGNIRFSSDNNKMELKRILENAMSEYFHYDAFVFIKTEKEIEDILSKNPFSKAENFHIYAFIGTANIEETLLQEFKNSVVSENESGIIVDHTFYWQIAKGNTLKSDFGKVLGKKYLKEKITSRNINTIEKIVRQKS